MKNPRAWKGAVSDGGKVRLYFVVALIIAAAIAVAGIRKRRVSLVAVVILATFFSNTQASSQNHDLCNGTLVVDWTCTDWAGEETTVRAKAVLVHKDCPKLK